MSDVPERWLRLATDAAADTYRRVDRDDPDPLADIVEAALEPVLADLQRQVAALLPTEPVIRDWHAGRREALWQVHTLLDSGGE